MDACLWVVVSSRFTQVQVGGLAGTTANQFSYSGQFQPRMINLVHALFDPPINMPA